MFLFVLGEFFVSNIYYEKKMFSVVVFLRLSHILASSEVK